MNGFRQWLNNASSENVSLKSTNIGKLMSRPKTYKKCQSLSLFFKRLPDVSSKICLIDFQLWMFHRKTLKVKGYLESPSEGNATISWSFESIFSYHKKQVVTHQSQDFSLCESWSSCQLPFLFLYFHIGGLFFFLLFFSLRYPHPAMQLAGMISSPFKCPRQRRTMESEPQPSVRIDSWRLIMTRKNGCLVPNKHKNCWQILIQHPWETKCSSGWTSTVTQAFLTGNGAPASYFLLICSLRWCHCENFEHGDVETFLWLGVSWQRPGPCQLIQADASLCAKKCENVKNSWGVLLLG